MGGWGSAFLGYNIARAFGGISFVVWARGEWSAEGWIRRKLGPSKLVSSETNDLKSLTVFSPSLL